ncbi:hypothetical protein SAMN03080615_03159 [Amphritea atlantica]|uniref:Uncharacterized protein n=1 Tax=Amphritea atlantica TaxID=355243 RepID=A0A1H9JS36_9GAMM|nr:hypothetical protein [Amphritea atlantica]SEQ89801.1 hypothetical protein SAMN03080615_03159 [Amphritea atlantica]
MISIKNLWKYFIASILVLIAINHSAYAKESLYQQKLRIVNEVLWPVMGSITLEDLRSRTIGNSSVNDKFSHLSDESLQVTSKMYLMVIANMLNLEEVKALKAMSLTMVGGVIVQDLPMTIYGHPALKISEEMYSPEEWQEWEHFLIGNSTLIYSIHYKMKNNLEDELEKAKAIIASQKKST